MTDATTNGGDAPPQALNPQIGLMAQYVRDLSFENVAAMKGGATEGRPDIKVGVNLDASPKGDNRFEVTLKLNAKATNGDSVLFAVELDYAGLFTVTGVPETHLRPLLMIECPRILFPFARRILADVTRDGGYPPLMLDLIDFAAIYRQEIERRRAAADAPLA